MAQFEDGSGYLAQMQAVLGAPLSDKFLAFWEAHRHSLPPFVVKMGDTGTAWGHRALISLGESDMLQPEIVISQKAPTQTWEITLAHELLHLYLDGQGFPLVTCRSMTERSEWDQVGEYLHSVLLHPLMWSRLKSFGMDVDSHTRLKAVGQLKDVRSRSDLPLRRDLAAWSSWALLYVLGRLEWPEPEREELREHFERTPIGDHGADYIRRLYKIGYDKPHELEPENVTRAARMLIQRLRLGDYLTLDYVRVVRAS